MIPISACLLTAIAKVSFIYTNELYMNGQALVQVKVCLCSNMPFVRLLNNYNYPIIIVIFIGTFVVLITVLSIIKILIMIIITINVIVFTFKDFLVPLLFVLFYLYISSFAIIFYFYYVIALYQCYCCFFCLFVLVCFAFSFYFWLNNSFFHMKRLSLVHYLLICSFVYLIVYFVT